MTTEDKLIALQKAPEILRAVKLLIVAFHDLELKSHIRFTYGENPLFIDFVKCTQATALNNNIKNSFDNFGEDEFLVTIYRMVGKEYNQKDRMTFVTSFHLKTINDLVGKIDRYREESEWDWMVDFKT